MPYQMNADDHRTLLARKASILESIAKHGTGRGCGRLTREYALEMISELTALASDLPLEPPPRSEEVSKAA